MAKFTIIVSGLHGHVNPSLPVVRELLARGHEVDYYAPESFREKVTGAGACLVPYESVYMDPIPELGPRYEIATMPARLMRELRHALPQVLVRLRASRPEVVIYDMFSLAGKVAARILGIPCARFSPTYVMNDHFPLAPAEVWSPEAIAYFHAGNAEFAREWDQPPLALDVAFHDNPDLNIVFLPRDFQPAGETFDDRYVFVGSTTEVDASLRPPGRSVYISLGTIFNEQPEFFRNCKAAFAGSDWKVVFSTGPQFDQLAALGEADVFLTHGGMNSTMEGLSRAIPLVVFPQMFEQAVNADRVVALGAGLRLRDTSPVAIRDAVTRVAEDPSFRMSAGALAAANWRAGGSDRAVRALEHFLQRNQTCRHSLNN